MDFNISLRSTADPNTVIDLSGTETVDPTKGVDTLTIVENASQTDPTTGSQTSITSTVTLESPGTDLSQLDPTQLTAAVGNLKAALAPVPACAAMLGNIVQILDGVLNAYNNAPDNQKKDPANRQAMGNIFQQLGNQADSLYQKMQGAYYLQNTKFVDAMIEVSQQLRSLENTTRNTAIDAEFDTMMQEAAQIKTEADDNYSAAMNDINASYVEASFQILGAVLTCAGGYWGAGKFGADAEGIGVGTQIGGALNTISSATGTMISNYFKTQSAVERKEAGYAQAIEKQLEADQKKLEAQENIASDLQQQSQALLDATLQMFRSIIETQSQTIQQLHV